MAQPPNKPSQFDIDEAYKQVKINTRQKALDYAFMLANANQNHVSASEVVSDATAIEDYILRDIEAPKIGPMSTIVPAKSMP